MLQKCPESGVLWEVPVYFGMGRVFVALDFTTNSFSVLEVKIKVHVKIITQSVCCKTQLG